MNLYYIDTSIWMDLYEDRKDAHQDLGDIAFRLFSFLQASGSKVLVSSLIQKELERFYTLEEIRGMVFIFEKSLVRVEISKEQIEEAKKIAKERFLPPGDVIHAILARDNRAVLITRDKHFEKLQDLCNCVKPEEIT